MKPMAAMLSTVFPQYIGPIMAAPMDHHTRLSTFQGATLGFALEGRTHKVQATIQIYVDCFW